MKGEVPLQRVGNHLVANGGFDDAARTATFAKPIQNGIGNKYNRPKGNGREAYQLINLLEEVDQPGDRPFGDAQAVLGLAGVAGAVVDTLLDDRATEVADGEGVSVTRNDDTLKLQLRAVRNGLHA